MRHTPATVTKPLFESLESRLLLSASVHHAAAHPKAVHHAAKPALHVAAAKKPVVKATAPSVITKINHDPIFMKFGSVTGEVAVNGYVGDIELGSFQWGASRAISSPAGGSADRESSAPSVSEITISKTMDKTSPLLMKAALVGQATSEVDIFFVQPSKASGRVGQPVTYAEYVLSNVLVSSYKVDSGGERPTESLTLNFTKVEFKYTPLGTTSPISTIYDLSSAQLA